MRQFLQDHDVRSYVNRHQALLGFLACLLIIAGTIGYVARESARTKHAEATTRHALCVLREDLQQRIESGKEFLSEHPEGIPGVPTQTILDGIANQVRTVDALRSLSC